jgi:hypothetical protein
MHDSGGKDGTASPPHTAKPGVAAGIISLPAVRESSDSQENAISERRV